MTIDEYIPLYNLLHITPHMMAVDGGMRSMQEIFDNYPDYELSDYEIDHLIAFDRTGLKIALDNTHITPSTIVTYLREMFDRYRSAGGNPMFWLYNTFENFNLKPDDLRAELRTIVEKSLIEWIDIYSKLPFDALYESTNEAISNLKGINSGYSVNQLEFIFYKLYNLDHLKENDIDNFVSALLDDYLSTSWTKPIWHGSRKKFYSFFDQITGRHEPSMMNKYFMHISNKQFDSNDKPGTRNHKISNILAEAKKIN